jgi:hypothetical protein
MKTRSLAVLVLAVLCLTTFAAHARVYNPALGRFLQRDPIGYRDGVNLYQYVGSRPIVARDPTGLCCALDRTRIESYAYAPGLVLAAGCHTDTEAGDLGTACDIGCRQLEGMGRPAYGATFCGAGICCICTDLIKRSYPNIQSQLAACAAMVEMANLSRCGTGENLHCAECRSATIGSSCLLSMLPSCNGWPPCEAEIWHAVLEQTRSLAEECPKCASVKGFVHATVFINEP